MKEDLELLIEEKWSKKDEFPSLISAIEKLTISKERRLALYQGNDFINVYKTFFDKHHTRWMKELLLISIKITPDNASTFDRCYLCIIEPKETELNIGECEVHK